MQDWYWNKRFFCVVCRVTTCIKSQKKNHLHILKKQFYYRRTHTTEVSKHKHVNNKTHIQTAIWKSALRNNFAHFIRQMRYTPKRPAVQYKLGGVYTMYECSLIDNLVHCSIQFFPFDQDWRIFYENQIEMNDSFFFLSKIFILILFIKHFRIHFIVIEYVKNIWNYERRENFVCEHREKTLLEFGKCVYTIMKSAHVFSWNFIFEIMCHLCMQTSTCRKTPTLVQFLINVLVTPMNISSYSITRRHTVSTNRL